MEGGLPGNRYWPSFSGTPLTVTFPSVQQAALHAGAAGAAVLNVGGPALAAGVLAVPVLLLRRGRRR